jgi:MoaA/NifB/PqqE/SkfB family radical SAM enzyme
LAATAERNRQDAVLAFRERRTIVDNLPTRLTVEPTSICNLRCVMCPHAINEVHRPKHTPRALIEKLRKPLGAAERVQLNGIGEPLASPSLWMALEAGVLSADAQATFNTNLTLMSGNRLRRLVDCPTRLALNVSLDAATPETYRRIRGFDFAIPLANIKALVAARRDNQHPNIMLNMTLMRENIEEAPAFVELAHSLGVDSIGLWHLNHISEAEMAKYVITRDGWTFNYEEQGLWNFPKLSNEMVRLSQRKGFELDLPIHFDQSKEIFFPEPQEAAATEADDEISPLAEPETKETVAHCSHPWDAMLILSDGTVKVCCYAAPIGNLNDQSFEQIWNGEHYRRLRSDLGRNVVSAVCEAATCKYVANTLASVTDLDAAAPAPTAQALRPAWARRWIDRLRSGHWPWVGPATSAPS